MEKEGEKEGFGFGVCVCSVSMLWERWLLVYTIGYWKLSYENIHGFTH